MRSKPLSELPAITCETSKCRQTGKFSWFIDVKQFHLANSDNAIPNNFHFYVGKDRHGLEKNKRLIFNLTSPKKSYPIFLFWLLFKHTPIFPTQKWYVGNSIVQFCKVCMKLTNINKSRKLTRFLTFGCLASHGRKFALGFWVHNNRLPLPRLVQVYGKEYCKESRSPTT